MKNYEGLERKIGAAGATALAALALAGCARSAEPSPGSTHSTAVVALECTPLSDQNKVFKDRVMVVSPGAAARAGLGRTSRAVVAECNLPVPHQLVNPDAAGTLLSPQVPGKEGEQCWVVGLEDTAVPARNTAGRIDVTNMPPATMVVLACVTPTTASA